MQWDGSSHRPMFDFLDGSHRSPANGTNFYIDHSKVEGGLVIKTLEGEHIANIGDYIIKGVKGEFYPCKPDIFAVTYDEVSFVERMSSITSDERSEEGVDSNALFDSLKSERDKLIIDLWGVFRRMSDIKPPESMKLDDLELWTKVTEHRTVQNILSNNQGDSQSPNQNK